MNKDHQSLPPLKIKGQSSNLFCGSASTFPENAVQTFTLILLRNTSKLLWRGNQGNRTGPNPDGTEPFTDACSTEGAPVPPVHCRCPRPPSPL